MSMIEKAITMLKDDGVGYVLHKINKKLFCKGRKPLYTESELRKQRETRFSKDICFSILVPLYNTPDKLLREMIESVLAQTYGNWELCLADGSDDAHGYVGRIVGMYAEKDRRIKYRKLVENKGISGNTNACIEMSDGEYIALFDHDDLLHPAALYEMMCVITERGADFIYTDEDSFYETPDDAYSPHYKPDFSAELLRSYNYICHFTAFSRELLNKVGGFRSDFDGSQDYDMFLRLTEQAERIVHIPKILYYWRNHAGSVASDVAVKPYTMVSAKKALTEHLRRLGLRGTVSDSAVPTTYRIQYEIQGNPLVSIIVSDALRKKECVRSLLQNTTYSNYELVTDEEPNGEYIVLLDGDTEIITPDWIEQMLMHAQRGDVGAVGAMLWYPDDTVHSAGKIIGIKKTAGDAHHRFSKGNAGYKFRMTVAQEYSAVSGKCMMVRKALWDPLRGFDPLYGSLADVDFCLRLREAGYHIIWTPYAELYYHGWRLGPSLEASLLFRQRWDKLLQASDPFYSPNYHLLRGDFGER